MVFVVHDGPTATAEAIENGGGERLTITGIFFIQEVTTSTRVARDSISAVATTANRTSRRDF